MGMIQREERRREEYKKEAGHWSRAYIEKQDRARLSRVHQKRSVSVFDKCRSDAQTSA